MSAPSSSTDARHATSYAAADERSLLHNGALVWLDEPVSYDDVLHAVDAAARARRELTLRPPRLPLASEVLGWTRDDAFRASRHVHAVALDAPADEHAVARTAGTLWERPLRFDRPPWEVDVLTDGDGLGVALLVKAHPALSTRGAAALVELLLGDGAETASKSAAPQAGDDQDAEEDEASRGGVLPAVLRLAALLALRGAEGSRALASEVRNLMRPGAALARTREVGRMLESAGTLVSSPAPETPWNGTLGNQRAVCWLSLPLDGLHAIARRFGGTWQDAWLTVVADALGRLLRACGRPTMDLSLLAFRPEPRGGDTSASSNAADARGASSASDANDARAGASAPDADDARADRPGPMLVALPVGELAPAERFASVHASARDPLSAARGTGLARMAAIAQRLPEPLQSALGLLAFQAANVVVASERAPQSLFVLGNRRVATLVPLAALPWQIGLALTSLEHDEHELTIGITLDPSRAPAPTKVVRALHDAYATLAAAADVAPTHARATR
ncbi:MAG TPA: wax ester/triacylglycerol synthase domain-containing protein [Candidatus Binatia bacterium]